MLYLRVDKLQQCIFAGPAPKAS